MSADDTVRDRADGLVAPQPRDINLARLIAERIRIHGPMPVAEYMATCLTHPDYGYYTRKDPLGVQGDFITAPEISQIFGEMIGIWMADLWMRQGSAKATLMELGPGRGTLMSDLLRATNHVPRFQEALNVVMVEASPRLTQIQQKTLRNAKPQTRWYTAVPELPPRPLFVIANEFFDALPVRHFQQTPQGWAERCVALDPKHALTFMFTPGNFVAEGVPSYPVPYGSIVEKNPEAEYIVGQLSEHIAQFGGAMFIADYGYDIAEPVGETLQAIREHRMQHVLDEPGSADITAHVNFHDLTASATLHGARAWGPVEQGVFLSRMGAATRASKLCEKATEEQKAAIRSGLERLVAPEQMGTLFKILAITPANSSTPAGF